MAMTGGPTIGVVVGGPLIDVIGWRGIFVVFGVLAFAATALGAVVVRPVKGHGNIQIDWLGTLLLAGGTLLILFGIIRAAGGAGVRDVTLLVLVGGALLCFVAFARWEMVAKAPLLDVRLFRRSQFVTPLVASACKRLGVTSRR